MLHEASSVSGFSIAPMRGEKDSALLMYSMTTETGPVCIRADECSRSLEQTGSISGRVSEARATPTVGNRLEMSQDRFSFE